MTTRATPRVSLVIPVYDAGPYLRPCLDSVVAQDVAAGDLEVIAVDDGSTDSSGELLDEYARAHPHLRVIHQANSGWPGRPRNVGLDAARGDYVFFLDADDELGPEALRRLADFADAHASDVVVPKMVGVGGRQIVEEVYASTQPDADRTLVFGTLTPGKLFRRSFMAEHGLRFPEGRIRLEDGQLVAKAYLKARRVSVYADYDCYFLRRRDDGGNISYNLGAPEAYTAGIAGVLDVVREHAPDPALADAVALDLYGRKALKQLRPSRYFGYDVARREAWVRAIGDLARAHVPAHVEDDLRMRRRLRSRLARAGDRTALEALLRDQEEHRDPPVRVAQGRVLLDLPHDGDPLDLTNDVRLYGGVKALHVRRDHVDVQGEVRLRGVRAARIPLRLVGGRAPSRVEQKVAAEAIEGSSWCWFDARIELGDWAARRGSALALRLRIRDGEDMWIRLARFTAPREDEEAELPLRAKLRRAGRAPGLMRLRRAAPGKSR